MYLCIYLCRLSEEDFRCVRRLVIRIILGTDMARHHDSVEDFTAALRLWGPDLGAWAPDKRVVALQVGRWAGCLWGGQCGVGWNGCASGGQAASLCARVIR